MIEMHGVSDYASFSYKQKKNVQENADGEFEDFMAGAGETPGKQGETQMSTGRLSVLSLKSAIDIITYSSNGRLLLLDSNLGVNLDTVF